MICWKQIIFETNRKIASPGFFLVPVLYSRPDPRAQERIALQHRKRLPGIPRACHELRVYHERQAPGDPAGIRQGLRRTFIKQQHG